MNKIKPVVGQKIWYFRIRTIVGETTVTKVGNKFFYVQDFPQSVIRISDWVDEDNRVMFFTSKQEYDDFVNNQEIIKKIHKMFRNHNNNYDVSTEDLKAIDAILSKYSHEERENLI
jgi:hypothetical protein